MNSFRESVANLIRNDKPESTSRALALFTGLNMVGWIWYALVSDKINLLLAVLAQVIAFILTLLAVKGYNDRKEKEAANVAATQQTTDSASSATTP